MRGDQLPAQPAQHVARSHHRRQARPRVGQGTHQRVRRRPEFRCDYRWFGRRASVVAGGADTERSAVPARIRTRRHPGAGRHSVLRCLRLHPRRGCDASDDVAAAGENGCQTTALDEPIVVYRRVACHPCFGRCPAVFRVARPQRFVGSRRASTWLRRAATGSQQATRRVRRATPYATRFRHAGLGPCLARGDRRRAIPGRDLRDTGRR